MRPAESEYEWSVAMYIESLVQIDTGTYAGCNIGYRDTWKLALRTTLDKRYVLDLLRDILDERYC